VSSAFDSVLLSLAAEAATGRIVRSLKDSGTRAIVLGGPATRQWLYGPEAHRDSPRIDLLVTDREAAQATVAGVELEEGVTLELHGSIAGIGVSPEQAWQVLSAETEELQIGGEKAEVLSEPGRALHVALHPAPGDLELALSKVAEPVWTRAADLAARLDALPAFAAGLSAREEGAALLERLGVAAPKAPQGRRGLPHRLLGSPKP
jgi:hypothetical protein